MTQAQQVPSLSVRYSRRKIVGQMVLAGVLVALFVLALPFVDARSARVGAVVGIVLGVGWLLMSLVVLGQSEEEVLAVDEGGLRVRAWGGEDGLRHLPWEDVASLTVRRRALVFATLAIAPVDPSAHEPSDDTARDLVRRNQKQYGAPFAVQLHIASASRREIADAVGRASGGRAQVS